MVSLHFKNSLGRALTLCIELWATEEEIPAGSIFTLHYPPPTDRPDSTLIELEDDRLIVWCAGETYEIDIDGKRIVT